MSKTEKILLAINALLYGSLAIFSYSYVDLNLTISQNKLVLAFVNTMQQLGYFNRPTATLIYLIWIFLAFLFFIINLWLCYRSKVSLRYLAISTVTNTLILVFAYPFLSSDLFNYMFDAKIILNYHASPYTHRPLDFPNDEWLRFMRWVHRYSPYGPLWLGMSLIPAFLGFGKFILNFLTFKIFIGVFHLLNTYLIYKILKKMNNKSYLLGTAFYAFNPLFLIEGVANAHNDVVLATFILLAIYLWVISKKAAYLSIFLGILIKYIPILNLPWLMFFHLRGERFSHLGGVQGKDFRRFILLNLITMALFTYIFSSFKITIPFVSSGATQVQFQPWYLFWTLTLIALLDNMFLFVIAIALSLGASLRYLPYLYYGDWSHTGTIEFMTPITIIPPIIALIVVSLKKRFLK